MLRPAITLVAGSLILGGCAVDQETPAQFNGHRSVFYNPYVAPELENGPVGPESGGSDAAGSQPYVDGLLYPGRGDYAYDRAGNRIRLTRETRRELRRRAELLEALDERDRLAAEMREREADVRPPVEPSAPATMDPNTGQGQHRH